jgi:hypothetical protein
MVISEPAAGVPKTGQPGRLMMSNSGHFFINYYSYIGSPDTFVKA